MFHHAGCIKIKQEGAAFLLEHHFQMNTLIPTQKVIIKCGA
jgi:hypothetical protein